MNIRIVIATITLGTITLVFFSAEQKILSADIAQTIFCLNKSQFVTDTKNHSDFISKQKMSDINLVVNKDETIKYLYENFDKYGDVFSRTIEQFENTSGWMIEGPVEDIKQSKEKYNGNYSLSITATPLSLDSSKRKDYITLKKYFSEPIDLSKWEKEGFITAWMKIQERKGIVGVSLRVGNQTGAYREFNQLQNLQLDVPNNYDQDDVFPDLEYPIKKSDSDEWTDFWLNTGWNYLPWRTDNGYYSDSGDIDIASINYIEIRLEVNGNLTKQNILFDNLRVQEGLQKEKNSLGGFWYSPNGRPQYGVFDIDKVSNNDYALRLLNVRQTQYPSNGDHARIISKYDTPLNFAMKTKFMLTDFTSGEKGNTWFRVTYDFEPDYDPGHDWFGAYLSSEWKKFGLITVIPLEKSTSQDQEPKKNEMALSSTDFTPKENILYELDITVNGQKTKATIYEVGDNCLKKKSQVEYQFSRLRYGNDKRYPVAIESTGNVKTTIYEIEMIEL